MAFARNQNQLKLHGDAVLGPPVSSELGPRNSIALWSRINLMAAEYGETRLRHHYLRVRFEDPDSELRYQRYRSAVHDGSLRLVDLCASEGLRVIAIARMHPNA